MRDCLRQVREVLRRLGQPVGLSSDELLATYRETLFNGLVGKLYTWGAFETALLRSITDQISAHPSPADTHRLVNLVVSALPYIGDRGSTRVRDSCDMYLCVCTYINQAVS